MTSPPEEHLRRAAAAVRQAPYVLGCLVLVQVPAGLAGLLRVLAAQEGPFSDAVGRADGVALLAAFLLVALGAWLWAVLGCYTSRTAQAAREAGNLPSGASLSALAWSGVFVPTGIAWAPFLAYRNAARYTLAVARYGRLRGAGEGWKTGPLPARFGAWWALVATSSAAYAGSVVADGAYDKTGSGVLLLLAAALGLAACAVGARVWAEVSRAADAGLA